jgi:SAM-dependent methyltransferase
MKLPELVQLRSIIAKYSDLTEINCDASIVIGNLSSLNAGRFQGHIELMVESLESAVALVNDRRDRWAEEITKRIEDDISIIREDFYKNTNHHTDLFGARKQRNLPISEEIGNVLIGRISGYADWHYPAIQLGLLDEGALTKYLVGGDPLYLLGEFPELLDTSIASFPIEYQNRTCRYLLSGPDVVKTLPQNNFGFVFSWSFFNYISVPTIEKYLENIFAALRPGGTMLFSYNDADTVYGAQHCEYAMVCTSKKIMVDIAENLGYSVTAAYSFDNSWQNISWLEIKKPGTLETIKAHQTMGAILDING